MIKHLLIYSTLFFTLFMQSQNTVGVIINTPDAYNGYTLFTSHKKTFLVNNCGELVREWTSTFTPGNSVYLLENGNLLRTGNTNTTDIAFGGQGGVIEEYSWEGDLLWQFYYDTPLYRQHHDIYPMPNGNILILAAKVLTGAQAAQAGRNPAVSSNPQNDLYTEQVVEVQPVGTNEAVIVWEWDMKDHLVQNFDATKDNYGNVSGSPQKLDINFTNGMNGSSNWLHVNSVQYNETLDQIILSSRNLSEIWIIDHSTTTAEAATGTGGTYGKGGDILYRWGNPQAYTQGTADDRQLFGQHHAHWIDEGLLDAGKIIIFNNGNGREPQYSDVYIIDPPVSSPGEYILESDNTYGPEAPYYNYSDAPEFNSHILSSAERLPNDNILICEGVTGRIFEIDQQENIVWQYINPVHNNSGAYSIQGNNNPATRQLFRATKYPIDYPAFEGKDLTPGDPIELNSQINAPCSILNVEQHALNNLKISPNPTTGIVSVSTEANLHKIEVYNILGAKISNTINSKTIDLSDFQSGIYLLKMFSDEGVVTRKIIKE